MKEYVERLFWRACFIWESWFDGSHSRNRQMKEYLKRLSEIQLF